VPQATTGAGPMERRSEIRALTGLRIVAAVWVMVGHLTWPLEGPYGQFLRPVWPILEAGWLGVDLFFVLSGFVIAWNYVDRMGSRFSWRVSADYVWARFARMWPVWAVLTVPFAAFLLFTDADAGTGMHRPVTLGALVEQLLMVQMWHRDYPASSTFIVPGWSLSVEWAAYLCFPLLVLVLWRLRNLPSVLLFAGAVAVIAPAALLVHDGTQPLWTLRIAGGFIAGALVAMGVRTVRRTATVQRLAALVAVITIAQVFIVTWWGTWRADGDPALDFAGVAVVLFPVLVGALALSDQGPSTWLSRETLVVGGRISFCLYLVHTIVFEVFDLIARRSSFLTPEDSLYVLLLPQLFLVAIGLSYVLHTRVEEPARLWLRDRGPSRWFSAADVVGPPAQMSESGSAPVPSPRPAAHRVPATASQPTREAASGHGGRPARVGGAAASGRSARTGV
jgi:peptidoglycan/LPS O-acetylase OafA/YrhL